MVVLCTIPNISHDKLCWYIVFKYIVAENSEATNLDDGSPILS